MAEVPKLRDTKQQLRSLVKLVMQVHESCAAAHSLRLTKFDDTSHQHRKMARLVDSTVRSGHHSKSLIQEALERIDHTLRARKEAASQGAAVPAVSDLREAVNVFFCEAQPILPSPYPPLCGALPFPDDEIIPRGSFACAVNPNIPLGDDGHYFLAYVFGFDPEKLCYHVCDADPELEEPAIIEVSRDELVPMPTSVPARRGKMTSYPLKSQVLSLWFEETAGWTTVFYTATVTNVPTTSPGFYGLLFEGDPPYMSTIPERFVVRAPAK